MLRFSFIATAALLTVSACERLEHVGKAPEFTPSTNSQEHFAMMNTPVPLSIDAPKQYEQASLWSKQRHSLLGDRRAVRRGDILTVVIEIDEEAKISNQTSRGRSGSDEMSIPQLFGAPQRIERSLPSGATLDPIVDTTSKSSSTGNGAVKRSEELMLRVAATVVDVLPNGVLSISGSQEVRVNFEMRELLVSGFVRPEDVSRKNEVTYDKIASARVSYGGRGQITDVQQPRIGQQILDAVLPF